MSIIQELRIRRVLDSRGNPTVEVDVRTASGFGRAAAPSGASTGAHEAQAFPEGGVQTAMEVFRREVVPKLLGQDASDQAIVDGLLHSIDGTEGFRRIGGNVAVATSLACAKAAAEGRGLPLYRYLGGGGSKELPRPLGNIIGGGRHARGGTDIQEFLSFAQGPTVSESIMANAMVHRRMGEVLGNRLPGSPLGKGDEGAWVAPLPDVEALAVLADACREISKDVGFPCRPALDVAASELYRKGKYHYRDGIRDPEAQIKFMVNLVDEYRLYSLEDPLDQEDFGGYARLTELVGKRCLIVGDDLFVTDVRRIEKGVGQGAANAVLIKPNQVGTLTDTVAAVALAHRNGYKTIMSHRSGETADASIAHLGVAFGCVALKSGAVGGERTAKLNELIRIEEEMV